MIPGVTGWKPSTATPIVIRFDSKGGITQALKSSQVKSATAMAYIAGVGIVIVSQAGIFKG
jgi:LDH2 family malate/lactate/ureidoglycolate dehydrogenase